RHRIVRGHPRPPLPREGREETVLQARHRESISSAHPMNVPQNLRYNRSHEWVLLEGDIATVGISDHAQEELTDVVFVELPPVGKAVDLGDPTAVVESVKAASDIYAPVSGEV